MKSNKEANKEKEALRKSDNPAKAKEAAQAFVSEDNLATDPLGSWTGNPDDPGEVPTQDVDDL